ncbi:hypothetical protein ER45_029905 (plasmid) [Bacillus mycoides]|nr:hypothetical protein ER45_029905 [Bacillus mycoides]
MKRSNMYKVVATTIVMGQVMVYPILSQADTKITNTKSPNFIVENPPHDELDFGNKSSEEISDFATKEFKKQTAEIPRYKIKAIESFNDTDSKKINQSLIENKNKPIEQNPNKDKIKLLDETLLDIQTKQTIKGYINQEGSLPNVSDLSKGQVINVPEYMTPSLNHVSGDKALWVIQIPKGTHAAYMNNLNNVKGESGLLIERGSRLQITHIATFNDRGALRTKIVAKLLPKEAQDTKGKIKQANQTLTEKLGLSISLEELSSSGLEEALERADQLISTVHEKVQNVPNGKGLFTKLAKEKVSITLQGTPFDSEESLGQYNKLTKRIQIDMKSDKHQKENQLETTLLHEIGHAVDFRLLNYISENTNFQQLFSQEKQAYAKTFEFNIDTLYAKKNLEERAGEYWADAFARFVLAPEKLKTTAPKTYEFIEKTLRNLLQ